MPRVSTYPDATTPLGGSDQLYVVQGGNSRKTNVSGLRSVLAPLPVSGAALGEWRPFSISGSSVSLALPAGGTWAFVCWLSVAGSADSFITANVAAGGTTVAGPTNGTLLGFCWRIT